MTATKSALDWLEYYESLGLHPVLLFGVRPDPANPCALACGCQRAKCGKSAGKHPMTKGWQTLPYDAKMQAGLRAFLVDGSGNIGLRMGLQPDGKARIAIDVDHPGKFAELEARLGALPDTLSTLTGRDGGGYHMIFEVPADSIGGYSCSVGLEGAGFDVRAEGGQVVAAPSTHYSGRQYDAVQAPIAALPAAWAEYLLALCTKHAPDQVGSDDPPEPSEKQDSSRDPEIVEELASIWQHNTNGDRAFGGLGGALLRAGVSEERAEWIAGALADAVESEHADPEERVLQAYSGACPLGWPALRTSLAANGAGLPGDAPGQAAAIVRAVLERVEQMILASVDAPVRAETPPPPPAASLPEMSDEEALLTWNGHLKHTQKGEIANTSHNTLWTLSMHPSWRGAFAYDEFTHEEVYLRKPDIPECPADVVPGSQVQDHHVTSYRGWFSRLLHHPSHDDLLKAVQTTSRERPRHAVREYLNRLRGTWDGQDRNLTAYFGAEPTVYQHAVCAKWLRSAIARVMQPPVQSDNMLILEGKQGIRKSSALRALCPDIRWYQEISSRAVGSKDFMQDMAGIWLAEFPEVDQMIRSREESELKALLTRTTDRYRPSYARKSDTFPRQMIFAGTTNEEDYLKDATGNRRYWPVKCSVVGPIRDGAICDDRDQIWAQALYEYENKLQWWLDAAEDQVAMEEQAERLEQDPWAELIFDWLEKRGEEPFTAIDVISAMPEGKLGAALEQRDINRMSRVLRKMGCIPQQCRLNGKKARWWTNPSGVSRLSR